MFRITMISALGFGIALLAAMWRAPAPTIDTPVVAVSTNALAEFDVGRDGRLLFVRGSVRDRELLFLVDTNVSLTIFDAKVKEILGAPMGRARTHTTGSMLETDLYPSVGIQFGNVGTTSTGPVTCLDLSHLYGAGGREFDAILGMDVLGQFVVQIDFDAGKMRLLRELPTSATECGESFSLNFVEARPHLNLASGAQLLNLALDTGSTDTCIEPASFENLKRAQVLQEGPSYSATTPTGTVLARSGLVESINVGSFRHANVLVSEGPMGLLGLTFLSRYAVTLDFPRRVAYLKPGAGFARPELLGTSGLSANRIGEKLVVIGVRPDGPAAPTIQPNDEIVSINGEAAIDLDMFRVKQLLTSGPGQPVQMRLSRHGREVIANFTTRDRLTR